MFESLCCNFFFLCFSSFVEFQQLLFSKAAGMGLLCGNGAVNFINLSYLIYLSFIIPLQWFSSFIDTTIQPKYMVLFHLFWFLLGTTVRLKIRVLITNLFQLYAHDISIKTYDPISFVFFFSRVLKDEFLLFSHERSTEIYCPLSFTLSFVHNHSTKS